MGRGDAGEPSSLPATTRAICAGALTERWPEAGALALYPAFCSPAPDRLYETDPALIVEVLSPSTEDHDRREKAVAYAESSGLQQLLLVDPDRRRIELARPAGGRIREWLVYGAGDILVTPYGDVDVDALYDAVDRTATTG